MKPTPMTREMIAMLAGLDAPYAEALIAARDKQWQEMLADNAMQKLVEKTEAEGLYDEPTGQPPCARFCEAKAFEIEIRQLQRALKEQTK